MYVKPAIKGAVVRDPANPKIPLPAEGRQVPDTTYWHRRVIQGDVIEIEEPAVVAERSDADVITSADRHVRPGGGKP